MGVNFSQGRQTPFTVPSARERVRIPGPSHAEGMLDEGGESIFFHGRIVDRLRDETCRITFTRRRCTAGEALSGPAEARREGARRERSLQDGGAEKYPSRTRRKSSRRRCIVIAIDGLAKKNGDAKLSNTRYTMRHDLTQEPLLWLPSTRPGAKDTAVFPP